MKKKDYKKPMLRVIELASDEVLATGCNKSEDMVSQLVASTCNSGMCLNSINFS